MKILLVFLLSISWVYGQKNDTLVGTVTVQTNTKTIEIQKPLAHLDISKAIEEKITNYFFAFFAGFSFLMTTFLFFKSVINYWDRPYLFSSLMFLCVFLNMITWFASDIYKDSRVIEGWDSWFNRMVPIMMILLYRDFFETKTKWPFFYKYITIVAWILFASVTISTFGYIQNYAWWNMISLFFNYALLACLLPFYPITFLRFYRHPVYKYAVWSNVINVVLYSVFMMIQVVGLPNPFPDWFAPLNLLGIATMLDGILFLFALTQRDRLVLNEKMQLEKQSVANEFKALHSQMNPHFIFNALNSIKSFTLNNDLISANFYLTKFSKLIRQVLENSRNEKISLKNELETLALYLDIEKLRVGDKFDYQINVNEDVETEFLEIPPMLIQPYIENSIWHGLMPKDEKGNVKIDIKQLETHITIVIEDNGIGREKANFLKSMNGSNHKSFGMKITTERLEILRQLYNIESKVTIEDLKKIDGTAAGTKVILEIPI